MDTSDSDTENIIERYVKSNTELSSIGWAGKHGYMLTTFFLYTV